MKIRIKPEMKKVLTLAEMPAAREIQRQEAEDTMTVAEYLERAARIASHSAGSFRIYDASASIARNCRVYNYYGSTGSLDVWLEGLAFAPTVGAFLIGAYLSDIFQITGDASEDDLLRAHMYLREYLPG